MTPKKNIKLSDLIIWVKNEILAASPQKDDPSPLFAIDEVVLEVNFTVSGEVSGDLNMAVVQADSVVKEERVQKATIRMKALIPPEVLAAELKEKHSGHYNRIFRVSAAALLKGEEYQPDGSLKVEVPSRSKK